MRLQYEGKRRDLSLSLSLSHIYNYLFWFWCFNCYSSPSIFLCFFPANVHKLFLRQPIFDSYFVDYDLLLSREN
jgi:hypothetical protein